jgi:putative tryptophan/tyrosine transport system substrate-binding protein
VKRREFITHLGLAVVAWPLAARAQRSERMPRIGVLLFGGETEFARFVDALRIGMAERGYQEGKNFRFEVRYSDQNLERLALNARELAAANVDLIWVPGSSSAQAAREATTAIPIVFAIVSDPVASGFIRSLASPGTNMTGLSLLSSEMWAKRLELLLEVRPDLRRLGVLAQPGEPASSAQLPHIQSVAAALGKELLVVEANSADALPLALGRLKEWRADALVIVETGLFLFHRKSLIEEATKNRWPTVNSSRQYTEVGGLIAYGVDYVDSCRRSAEYVDRILKGARPADLPVQQPSKFELVVNLKAARTLGLVIPPTLLARADEVIE